jgi:hypothetical protein
MTFGRSGALSGHGERSLTTATANENAVASGLKDTARARNTEDAPCRAGLAWISMTRQLGKRAPKPVWDNRGNAQGGVMWGCKRRNRRPAPS